MNLNLSANETIQTDYASSSRYEDPTARFEHVRPVLTPVPATKAILEDRDARDLSTLVELSRVVGTSTSLADVVSTLAARLGFEFAIMTLRDPETGDYRIEEAHGLPTAGLRRGRYRTGEGIIGSVIESGQPILVPSVAREPRFLHRAVDLRGRDDDYAYICTPIKVGQEVIGTLSAEKRHGVEGDLGQDARVLQIISSMVALAVRQRLQAREERKQLEDENLRLQAQLDRQRPTRIVGNDKRMREVYAQIARVAASATTVVIRGESGTGKELVAEAIHQASDRRDQPFIKVNCAALPDSILESELFGHERGAFTGAIAARKGRFELAEGGTIFLDEVADFSPATQVKLLRVLQEREFERIGSGKTLHANIRVLAATNRDLEALVKVGAFREDLYYRLNVFEIAMPPLRERRSDIPLLAHHFVEKYARQNDKRVRRISMAALDMMMAYHWPGNVRELENSIERAVLLASDDVIRAHHLPPTLQTAEASGTAHSGTLAAAMARLERELIADAIERHHGNKAAAARALGMTERVMGLRVSKYGIESRRYRG